MPVGQRGRRLAGRLKTWIGEKEMLIYLTPEEMAVAEEVGRRRNDEDIAAGHPPGGGFDGFGDGGYLQNIIGVRGEIAFSKFLGIKYVPPKMKARDVGGYEVRTVSEVNGRLSVKRKEIPENLKMTLLVMVDDNVFRPAGWFMSGDAERFGVFENPRNSAYGGSWFVRQNHLNAFGRDLEWGGR